MEHRMIYKIRKPMNEPNYRAYEARVIWDAENITACKVKASSLERAVKKRCPSIVVSFVSVANENIHPQQIATCKSIGTFIPVQNVDADGTIIKDAADREIIKQIYEFVLSKPPPNFVILVSNDTDFARVMEAVTYIGYTTMRIGTAQLSQALVNSVIYSYNISKISDTFPIPIPHLLPLTHFQKTQLNPDMTETLLVLWDLVSHPLTGGVNQTRANTQLLEAVSNHVTDQMVEDFPEVHNILESNFNVYTEVPPVVRLKGLTYTIVNRLCKVNQLEGLFFADLLMHVRSHARTPESCVIIAITNNKLLSGPLDLVKRRGFRVVVVGEDDQDLINASEVHLNTPVWQ